MPQPGAWLKKMQERVRVGGRIVLTTPRPSFRWAHELGARLKLFSREAAEEHQALLDYQAVEALSAEVGLHIAHYRPFLLGCNQLFVLVAAPKTACVPAR